MSRTVYVNGDYMPEEEAKVSVFDRGFLFADGVYEVTSVLGGKLIDFEGHARRLQRSLAELEMKAPVEADELLEIHRELVTRNGIEDGLIYLQVTRGACGSRLRLSCRGYGADARPVHAGQAGSGREPGRKRPGSR